MDPRVAATCMVTVGPQSSVNVDSTPVQKIAFSYVTAYCDLERPTHGGLALEFLKRLRIVATDSHFLIPFCVLIAGIVLLVVLH